jgi:biotin carboxyl carrier protein
VKLEIELAEKMHHVEFTQTDDRVRCVVEGRAVEADAREVGPGIYSILIGAQSLEARVESHGSGLRVTIGNREFSAAIRDPRQWRRRRSAAAEAEGQQQVIAPMPGKIVRVLVKAGEKVEAGQGLLVVEAMKMQNEIRSPKSGRVERLFVVEGQTVNAGEMLAKIV